MVWLYEVERKNGIYHFSVGRVQEVIGHSVSNSHDRNSICSLLDSFWLAPTTVKPHLYRVETHLQHAISHIIIKGSQFVCIHSFLFIGMKIFKNMSSSFQNDGILPRVHGNTKRFAVEQLFTFLYPTCNILLGKLHRRRWLAPSWSHSRGYASTDLKSLPSSKSKTAIWKLYEMATYSSDGIHAVAYSTFSQLWRALLPSIIILRPMSDLCWQCQQNSYNDFMFCPCPETLRKVRPPARRWNTSEWLE